MSCIAEDDGADQFQNLYFIYLADFASFQQEINQIPLMIKRSSDDGRTTPAILDLQISTSGYYQINDLS